MLIKHTRDELIALVEQILRCSEPSEQAMDALVQDFCSSVSHPGGSDLIYYPEKYFGKGYTPTEEEIVDKAIAHRSIQLPSGTP